MLRKLSIVPIFLAMMMVTLATILPHHHHQTMICIVEEVCAIDGCRDDEHTQHSDANHNQDESHCVAHKHYCPSETFSIDNQDYGSELDNLIPILAVIFNTFATTSESTANEYADGDPTPKSTPPLAISLSPNAPPMSA